MVGCQITARRRGIGSPFLCFSSFFSDFVSSLFPDCWSSLGSLCCCGSPCFGSSWARREVAFPKRRIAKQINEKELVCRMFQFPGLRSPNKLGDRLFSSVFHGGVFVLGALRSLNLVKFRISSSGCKKLLMSALFHELGIFDHENTVCVSDGSQMMGDEQCSTSFHQAV